MKRTFLYTLLVAGLLASCTNDELADNPLANGPVAAKVTAGINQTLTRVSADGTSFTDGDKINVIADDGAYEYIYGSGTWNELSPYYFQDLNDVNFKAWYATAEPENNAISVNTTIQTVTDGWNQWDILVTPTVAASASSPTINFTGDNAFSHIMSQVTLTFREGEGVNNLTGLTAYTLKNLVTEATFNTLTCELENKATTGDVSIMDISGVSGPEYSATPLILLPQAVTSNQIALEVTYNNQVYKANLSTPTNGLQAGYSYAYTVTIKNTGLEISNSDIKDWQSATGYQENVDAEL